MTSAFERFKNAKSKGGAFRYFQPGEYVVRLRSAKFDHSQNPGKRNAEYFAVAVEIVEAAPQNPDDPEMKAGKVVDWTTFEDKPAYEGNVKQFWCAAVGCNEAEMSSDESGIFDKLLEGITGAKQVGNGRLLHADVQMIKTKAGKDFTAVRWSPVPEEDQDRVAFDKMVAEVSA